MQYEPDTAEQCPIALLLVTAMSYTSAFHNAPSCPTQLLVFGMQRCSVSPFFTAAAQQKTVNYSEAAENRGWRA